MDSQSQIGWQCHLAFEEAQTLTGQFASLTFFVADTKLGKKLKYFDHWVGAFIADGFFSSITFQGSVGERGEYSNRIFKVKEIETWLHFTGFVPNLGIPMHLHSSEERFPV